MASSKKKILVVGGAGYIGGAVTDILMQSGAYDFRVYDNLTYEESYRKPVDFVYGDILSRNPGWTTPMRTSVSGPGTISGNAIAFGWTGTELKTEVDITEFYIHTCTPVGNGCDDYKVSADISAGAFDIRCPGIDVMRGIKWDGASTLSVICAR